MNILIVHGYFLEGNGSNIYVYNLAKEIKKNGHRAIILSQENKVNDYSLVDRIYEFSFGNKTKKMTYKSSASGYGECILIKPEIQGVLPMYKKEEIEGFEVREFHEMKNQEIYSYSNLIISAVENILEEINIDLIISTHLFPEPFITEIVRKKHPRIKHYCIVDGNCFYYSYYKNKSLKDFITPIFSRVDSLIFLNREIIFDLIQEFPGCSESIKLKGNYIPAGVDTEVFTMAVTPEDKNRVFENLKYKIRNDKGDTSFLENFDWENNLNIMTYGDFSLEKGIPLLFIIFPFIREFFPEAKLYIAGKGGNKKKCEKLIKYLSEGNRKDFYLVLEDLTKEYAKKYGKDNAYEICYLNILDPVFAEKYFKCGLGIDSQIEFAGYLNHGKLSHLVSLMDLCVFPVIAKEGFSISVIEALSSGVPVVIPDNTGMSDIEESLRKIYQNDFDIKEYKEIKQDENFLDNIILNITYLLNYIKSNKENAGTENIKRKVSEEIIKNYSWFSVYENIIKTSRNRS